MAMHRPRPPAQAAQRPRREELLRPLADAGTGPGAYRPPPPWYSRMQWLGFLLTRLGLSPRYVVTLEVPGRATGVVRRTNLVQADLGGQHHLVSVTGNSQWVRNVRAAHGRVVLGRGGRRVAATLVEVPAEERPPVLRAYLHRAGRQPGSPAVRNEARAFFGVDDLAELGAAADRHPVFRVLPYRSAAG